MNRSRHGRRRVDLTVVLVGALPLLVVGALSVTRPDQPQIVATAPAVAPLTSAEVICPSAIAAGASPTGTLTLGSDTPAGTSGQLRLTPAPASGAARTSGAPESVEVTSPDLLDRNAPGSASVIAGTAAVAPGLLGSVTSAGRLSAWDCTGPVGEQWFTGVGAGPTQSSVVELINPNRGPAIADIEVLSDEGVVAVPALRGVAVAATSSVRLDLGALVPRTGVMALHVSVVRGQLGVVVRDRGERLSGGTTTQEWLSPQTVPARANLMLGLQPGSGRHTLVIANPGANQLTAAVKLITPETSFAPDGVKPITVPPRSVVSVVLDQALRADTARDAVGLEVEATEPVVTSVRSVVDGDLSFVVPGDTLEAETALLVPEGTKSLVLAGAEAVGLATVVGRSAGGKELVRQRISLGPKKAPTVALPPAVRIVQVTPERTEVSAAVLVTGDGSTVLRLRPLVRSGAVPAVSFGP